MRGIAAASDASRVARAIGAVAPTRRVRTSAGPMVIVPSGPASDRSRYRHRPARRRARWTSATAPTAPGPDRRGWHWRARAAPCGFAAPFARVWDEQRRRRRLRRRQAAHRGGAVLRSRRAWRELAVGDFGGEIEWRLGDKTREILGPVAGGIHIARRAEFEPHRHHPAGAVRRRESKARRAARSRRAGIAKPSGSADDRTAPPAAR